MDATESSQSRICKRDYEGRVAVGDVRTEDEKGLKSNMGKDGEQSKLPCYSQADGGDNYDCDTGKEQPFKIAKRNLEERGEPRLSQDYQGTEEGSEVISSLRTSSGRSSGQDRLQSRGGSRVEGPHEVELEKAHDKELRNSDRKESSREKGHGPNDEERNPQHGIFDEADSGKKAEENSLVDRTSDNLNHGASRERPLDSTYESGDDDCRIDSGGEKDVGSSYREKRWVVDSRIEKDGGSDYREEEIADQEMNRTRGRSDAQGEHFGEAAQPHEARSDMVRDDDLREVKDRTVGVEDAELSAHWNNTSSAEEKENKYRLQRVSARDDGENREMSDKMDEDGLMWMRDRNCAEDRVVKRPRTPERGGGQNRELDQHNQSFSEYGNERTGAARDDRSSKGKDTGWSDKNRDQDNPKDRWKITQFRRNTNDADRGFDHAKDWTPQRREQERVEEKLQSRPNYRREARIWPEDVKISSKRNINEKSDSIEIKPDKNLDFEREESVSTYTGRRTEVGSKQDIASTGSHEEWLHQPEDWAKSSYEDDLSKRFHDDDVPMDQGSGRNSLDSLDGRGRGQRGPMNPTHTGAVHNANGYSQSPLGNNQVSGSLNRVLQQGPKGARPGRGRRITGRDVQRAGTPLAMMVPPFGHLGLPPGPMQPIGLTMSHSPGPHIGSGVFIPQFPGPLVWPGAQGVDMNMLAVPPNLSIPSGPPAPKLASNMGYGPNQPTYFNQSGSGRGSPSNSSVLVFNPMGTINHDMLHDKAPTSRGAARNSGPTGKAPSRGEQNDYSQNFVDTGMRPQNFIRELELTSTVEDYPKLRELIQRKDEIVAKSASPPMYHKCDLREFVLTPEFFSTKFDVILVDPPWEEYVHRAPGVTDHLEYWPFEEIQNLKIEAIADTPSFLFLWVGDGVGLEQGRQCLKKWGFRRCEDICWVKTNKKTATPGLRHDSRTLFQHSKEHCLMGIKGTVRRSTDGHIIHANIDTDIVIAEEPTYGSTKKPDDMYKIIEHFALGKRRLELFGEDHNIRSGWLTLGKGLSSSNFNSEAYIRNFSDKDGKVWQGGGGRNPPPETPHLVLTTPEIEGLRPKSPPPKNQQQQTSMSLMTTGSSTNRRSSGNSPQTTVPASHSGLNQEVPVSQPTTPAPWGSPGSQGPEGGYGNADDKSYDSLRFNASSMQPVGDHHEFDPRRASA